MKGCIKESGSILEYRKNSPTHVLGVNRIGIEEPTVEKVHSFIEENGSKRTGKHHEIYLSDIRRAAPEKWKIIIRQPMS